jgi:hypothetical protein
MEEVSLAQLAMEVDVQPRHPGSNPHECEFGFLLFIKKTRCGGLPHRFPFKKNCVTWKQIFNSNYSLKISNFLFVKN